MPDFRRTFLPVELDGGDPLTSIDQIVCSMFEEERVVGDDIETADIKRVVDLGNCRFQSRSKPIEFLILLSD
ncbi:MAG: hypothetical protein B7Y12_17640 [Rhizobiales bacterium 24-66-13]|nr:MAG: hypothetical protein B7Y61_02470 [Rhizobiales bacterium 35-66-30]OYZ70992.1 MAG: hypothetical protein B7Y12_17640 [Rhizobiales bacterium 24-66-13]OZB11240.1 MAG: hypothetical protein B7X67_04740 [Rhizobiales bacterium 39-66-18]